MIRLHSDYIQTTFRLHSDYIQTTFRLHSDYIQTTFILDYILSYQILFKSNLKELAYLESLICFGIRFHILDQRLLLILIHNE